MDSVRVGFHCSHEQHPPSALLQLARRAEAAGFRAAMCSDHFHPWSIRQGHSGFAWSWLGAALEATGLSFGTVCAPGQRYHPAVIAQAAATLGEMFGERFWLAVGSGEALNESITGDTWPAKPDRNDRLEASAEVMRALWRGETVTRDGSVRVRQATLFSRPSAPPMLIGAALSPPTARWMARWADGLITASGARENVRATIDAFREGGGDGKPLFLQVALAFGRDDAESEHAAYDQWRQAALGPAPRADIETAQAFDEAASSLPRAAVLQNVRASADVERQLAWLVDDLDMGFSRIYLHNVVRDHDPFFEACAARLLPALQSHGAASRPDGPAA